MNNIKPSLVFCAPIKTASGYGEHSRDLLRSLIDLNMYEISVISINWGDTPMNALDENNTEHKRMLDLIRTTPLQSQPDVWMQCTIPNEFQAVGKYNIGITAGIETDICSPEWVDGCNRMNLVIVPSKHAKDAFINASYEKIDKATNRKVEALQINVPIEVLHEGVRLDIFSPSLPMDAELTAKLDTIKEDFAFLFVGHWMKGDIGQDRKDLSGLVYTFFDTFGDTENPPALVLKASNGTYSIMDRGFILRKIDMVRKMLKKTTFPSVYVLHGELTDSEMNTLYNHEKIKALVSFTKGEGYGRPIAEFITTGKPVAVSGWSGHTDFVNPVFHTYLDGQLTPVHDSAVWEGIINKGTNWFTVDYRAAGQVMKDMTKKYKSFLYESRKSVDEINTVWSYDAMKVKFGKMLEQYVPKFAQKVPLKLPTLKQLPTIVGESK